MTSRPARIFPPLCLAAAMALGGAHAANVTWTNTAFGNWADGTNWSTNPNPPAGGDTIFFNLADGAAPFNTGFNFSGTFAVNGIRHMTGTGTNTVSVFAGPVGAGGAVQAGQSAVMQLGSEGILVTPGSFTNGAGYLVLGGLTANGTNVLTLETTGNQSWISNGNGFNAGRITVAANLAGSGTITVSGSGGPVVFDNGNSSAFTGAFVLNSSAIRLNGAAQLGRLGPNALTVQSGGLGTGTPTLNFTGLTFTNTTHSFANNIVFQDTGAAAPIFSVDAASVTGTAAFAYSGNWSGAINDSLTLGISNANVLGRLQGNNASLTSTKTASGFQNNSAIFMRTGNYSIENANALGSGNSLTVSIGQSGADFSDFNLLRQSLLTNDGINVASPLFVNYNNRGAADTARGSIVTLGLRGTGTAAFTGTTTFQTVTKATNEGASATNRLANVKLSAGTGGKAVFAGNIVDDVFDASTRNYAPVSVLGGGVVELGGVNNTYRGGTSIIGGTTLLANGGGSSGSSTGLGNVYVGWAANSFSGTLTSGQSFITGVSSVSGLVVGQTITGAGISAGTTITYIDPTRNRIEISANATASGSASLGTDAATGVLGGSGHIRPGVVNGVQQKITVAAGSSIAPGNSIGTLVLDGASTGAPLLTMDAGSTFTFELGAGNTSDQLSFWNFATGDFALNGNVINFTGAQEGTFTLFTFYSGAGSGLIDAGIDSGLVVGAGLEGFTYELIYNDNNIMLSVVPEPGACVLAGLGLTVVLGMRRRRA